MSKKINLILSYEFDDLDNLKEFVEECDDGRTIDGELNDKIGLEEVFYQSDITLNEIKIIGYQIEGKDIVYYGSRN